jgi:hypothetical protein
MNTAFKKNKNKQKDMHPNISKKLFVMTIMYSLKIFNFC